MTTNSGKFSAENDLQNTTSMSYFWIIISRLNEIISEGYFLIYFRRRNPGKAIENGEERGMYHFQFDSCLTCRCIVAAFNVMK